MSYAQLIPAVLNLPAPGAMVTITPGFSPAIVKGITIHPDNPLMFDFIVHPGDDGLEGEELRNESTKLIKYFLASLTTPEDQMWVNLSPYEKDRIVPDSFGETEMGRDLLAQDYLLKQLSASLMYPENELGQKFWNRVHKKAYEQYGTTDIPMNTFNKIWIVPEKAVVYENGQSVFVVESHLKIMLEEDYTALEANVGSVKHGAVGAPVKTGIESEMIREILIPEIEKEVNEGETFANLRQIYNSVILATWYKKNLKESLLGQVYVDQNKTKGIDVEDKSIKEKIYNQYVEAFKKGVYDFIKEDYDPVSQEIIPRKYFSGGALMGPSSVLNKTKNADHALLGNLIGSKIVQWQAKSVGSDGDHAMTTKKNPQHWKDAWPKPNEDEFNQAKEVMIIVVDMGTEYDDSFPQIIENEQTFIEGARILRAMYYIAPNVAGLILTAMEKSTHRLWKDIITPDLLLSDKNSIEPDMLGEIISAGLRIKMQKKIVKYNRKQVYAEADIKGISGLMRNISRANGHILLDSVHEDLVHILVEQISYEVLFSDGIREDERDSLYLLLKEFSGKKLKEIQSRLSPDVRKYLTSIDKLPKPKAPPLTYVENPIPKVVGRGVGKLIVLAQKEPTLEMLQDLPSDAIVAMTFLSYTQIESPQGILTFVDEGRTSHAQSKANDWNVPHAVVPGPDYLAQFKDKKIYFEVTENNVIIREATDEDLKIIDLQNEEPLSDTVIDFPKALLTGDELYLPPGHTSMTNPQEVGYKVALLNQWATQPLTLSDPDIKVHFATGSSFPFKTFSQILENDEQLSKFNFEIKRLESLRIRKHRIKDPLFGSDENNEILENIQNLFGKVKHNEGDFDSPNPCTASIIR